MILFLTLKTSEVQGSNVE